MSTVVDGPRTSVRSEPPLAGPPARRVWSRSEVVVSRTLIAVAGALGWIVVFTLFLSSFEQAHDQHELYGRLRTQLAEGTAPTGAPIATGAPVALLQVPDAGIKDLVVVEGTGAAQLKQGPGHLRGSVLPGQQGVSVLLGRALSYGGPFGHLADLKVGDPITVTTGQGRFVYRVTGARRRGSPVPAAPAADASRLTLVAAVGSGRLARLTPSDTVYFDAALQGKAVGGGPVAASVPTEAPMRSGRSVGNLALLVLALQLLALVLLAMSWARVHWSPRAAWIVGVPVVLAALWVASSVASLLLPNLL